MSQKPRKKLPQVSFRVKNPEAWDFVVRHTAREGREQKAVLLAALLVFAESPADVRQAAFDQVFAWGEVRAGGKAGDTGAMVDSNIAAGRRSSRAGNRSAG